jgi:hypothetical protein
MHKCSIPSTSVKILPYLTILLLALGSQAMAQSARARIVGTVRDPHGAVVAGASVTVISVAT